MYRSPSASASRRERSSAFLARAQNAICPTSAGMLSRRHGHRERRRCRKSSAPAPKLASTRRRTSSRSIPSVRRASASRVPNPAGPISSTIAARQLSADRPNPVKIVTPLAVGSANAATSKCSVPIQLCRSARASCWARTTTSRASWVNRSNIFTAACTSCGPPVCSRPERHLSLPRTNSAAEHAPPVTPRGDLPAAGALLRPAGRFAGHYSRLPQRPAQLRSHRHLRLTYTSCQPWLTTRWQRAPRSCQPATV
jgi:hypothetical protein